MLCSISEEYKFLLVKGILKDNKIPYFTKEHNLGGFLRIQTGSALWSQTDIYVSEYDYEKSKQLTDVIFQKQNE